MVKPLTGKLDTTFAELCERFGLGEHPLRAALKQLDEEKVIEYEFPRTGRGWVRVLRYAGSEGLCT